jgi:signal transduction histidine kinase
VGPDEREADEIPELPTHLTDEELEGAIPLYAGGVVVGFLVPEFPVPVPTWIETDLFFRLNRSAIIAAGIAAFLSALLASLLAFVLLRPIRELTGAAQAMGAGDLEQRVLPRGGRETILLAKTFNRMADSLQSAEKRRRALTADIAHELRNPLAIQRANLEALQDGVYPLTAESLETVIQQNLLLEHLVEDLRTLAIADAGEMRLEITSVDLPALLNRRGGELAPEAAARSVELRTELAADCPPVEADPARIGQITLNLLRNALEHAPPGGWVELGLTCAADAVEITVRDSGPGIPEEDLPHIFERFFRGDKSRERLRGATGLGLSIARQLAVAHGGSLIAANHPEGGALFRLTLPAARTSG